MRVLGGTAKAARLTRPKGTGTRATSEKVRGAIFSMVEVLLDRGSQGAGDEWSTVRVLDLFAGTGALGIEALSRGAASADFVESDKSAYRALCLNVKATGLSDRARLHRITAENALSGHGTALRNGPYGLVVADPPYDYAGLGTLVAQVATRSILGSGGLFVLEHSKRCAPPVCSESLRLLKTRKHGDTCISVYVMA